MATAIVTDMTNRHSCSVDSKHVGRAFGSLSLIGGKDALASAPSSSGAPDMLKSCHSDLVFALQEAGPNALTKSQFGDEQHFGHVRRSLRS